MNQERTLTLHHPKGHPYWQRNKFNVQMPHGEFIDLFRDSEYNGEYGEEVEINVKDDGIYAQYFMCSSGGGKRPYGDLKKLVCSSQYDKIVYKGKPLIMPKALINELKENQLPA